MNCCNRRTWPCTMPRGRAAIPCASSTRDAGGHHGACRSGSRICVKRCRESSSCSTTRRRWIRPVGSPVPKPCCAGSIPSAVWCRRQSSFPWSRIPGLIVPLGQWVLDTACERLAAWADRPALAHLTMAVNVSARQFHDEGFVDQVLAALARSGARPQRLKLELTESLLVNDVARKSLPRWLHSRRRASTFRSTTSVPATRRLSYLKRLPLDQLKIDQSFIRNILTDVSDAAIARMVVVLAESLGLRGHRRGRGNRGAEGFPRQPGLSRLPGLPVQPPAAGRRLRGVCAQRA
jgi:hypothetical protein